MKKCILCSSEYEIGYGDEVYGEVFCKQCFDTYSCVHCHKMNIIITFIEGHVTNVHINKLYGQTVSKNSIVAPLVGENYKFKLYCKECWDNQEIYVDEDQMSIVPEDDDIDSYDSDYAEDINEEEQEYIYDSYYIGKGKDDLY